MKSNNKQSVVVATNILLILAVVGALVFFWQVYLYLSLSRVPKSCSGDFSYQTKCPAGSICKSAKLGPLAGGECVPVLFSFSN